MPSTASSPEATITLDVQVDARELPRHLLHTRIRMNVSPGKLRLWYPKWIPGTHGPFGRVEDIGGLRIRTAEGKTLPWRRDPLELFCIECDVPDDVRQIEVELDTICNAVAFHRGGCYSDGNHALGVINWNTCVMYPEGYASNKTLIRLRLLLPDRWKFATVLKADSAPAASDGTLFRTVTMDELMDNPLIAGIHMRAIELDSGPFPPASMHLVSESPSALELDPKVVDMYSNVVKEAGALFGKAHYPEYQFLVTLSDDLSYHGLEHHACSINGVGERDLIEDRNRKGWVANLLPHEYAHSWCGKFRRPKGMCVTNYHTPQDTRLLWVYEGLATYLGDLLMVRSGLVSPDEYRQSLAWHVSDQMHRAGRRWRSLEDTAASNYLLRAPSNHWSDLRRDQDFYMEGLLLWLEVDTILRDSSQGRYSLNDFCQRFMGAVGSDGADGSEGAAGSEDVVVPYEQADIVRILKQLADHDWEAFFVRRVSSPMETLPLDVIGRCGYRVNYASKPSSHIERLEQGQVRAGFITARDSLGLTFTWDGTVSNVVPGMPGEKAGFGPGMQVAGVNGKKFHRGTLHDALVDSRKNRKIEFMMLQDDEFKNIIVEYAGGPRYLELVRDESTRDVLSEILKPARDNKN